MKNKFFFTAGIVGMLSSVASGADVDYGREWNPYVTLRGGWLFGKRSGSYDFAADRVAGDLPAWDCKKSIGSALSGSCEWGVSCWDERLLIGLELGYFTWESRISIDFDRTNAGGGRYVFKGTSNETGRNLFCACNVALRHFLNEKTFLYGGVGAGLARTEQVWEHKYTFVPPMALASEINDKKNVKKWRFLVQMFAGIGFYLNDNWSLNVRYRLRYVPSDFREGFDDPYYEWFWKSKQNLSHAAEVGLMYQW